MGGNSSLINSYNLGKTTNATSTKLADGTEVGIVYNETEMKGFHAAARGKMATEFKDNPSNNPMVNFARIATFFAGQQEFKMNIKLNEYKKQHDKFIDCLDHSKEAHAGKADAVAKKATESTPGFTTYMKDTIKKTVAPTTHTKEEWQSYIDLINQQKDMESTDLNKLSTEMEVTNKDSSSAFQMANNATTSAGKLMSTQGKLAGG